MEDNEIDEDFDQIIDDNFMSTHPSKQPIQEKPMNQTKTIDGIVMLILLVLSIALLVWAATDVSWGQLRLVGGLAVFSVMLNYAKEVTKK